MNTILATDMTLERLEAVFVAKNVPAHIVEYFPATKDSPRDAVLSVDYPEDRSVLVWPEEHESGNHLRIRAIVLDHRQRDEIPDEVLLEVAADLNQNAECFGALSVHSVHGVTIEYLIPFQDGVLAETVRLAAERVARGTGLAREEIQAAVDNQ